MHWKDVVWKALGTALLFAAVMLVVAIFIGVIAPGFMTLTERLISGFGFGFLALVLVSAKSEEGA